LTEHNSGKTKSIRFSRPFKLVFSQKYNSIGEARKIEVRLKKLKSRTILNRIIKEEKIKIQEVKKYLPGKKR